MFAVTDPVGYLLGSWTIERQLTDVRTGQQGSFAGCAVFTADDAGLRWLEDGELVWAGVRRRAGRELSIVRAVGNPVEVRFADGRTFHLLDLSAGRDRVTHDCGADRYAGVFTVADLDSWSVGWDVAGPAKSLRIESRYCRRPR